MNPYGWSKWTNECQMQASGLNNVGLRFFTVYGPWGRPDMALFSFTKNIIAGEPIPVFNFGNMKRDFTYVEDILDGIECVIFKAAPSGEIYNIGRGSPVDLMDFIKEIAKNVGIAAVVQPGGSIKDQLSVDYCDANELAMVMTGIRHFRH